MKNNNITDPIFGNGTVSFLLAGHTFFMQTPQEIRELDISVKRFPEFFLDTCYMEKVPDLQIHQAMKSNILTLIQDDIKISRLTNALDRLHVPSVYYPLGNSKVVFSLMGIPEEEPNLEIYYKLIEQAADLDHEKIEELAEGIFRELMGV
jgi:hypothetical protein